jgi:hypothetical protein
MVAMNVRNQDQIGGRQPVEIALGRVDLNHLPTRLDHEGSMLDGRNFENAGRGLEFLGRASGESR